MLALGHAHLDVLLDCLHVSVELLSVTALVFKCRPRQLLEVLGAADVLGEVVCARRARAREPVRALQITPPLGSLHAPVIRAVVIVDLKNILSERNIFGVEERNIFAVYLIACVDAPACDGDCGAAPEDYHDVGVTAMVDQGQGRVHSAAYPHRLHTVPHIYPETTETAGLRSR